MYSQKGIVNFGREVSHYQQSNYFDNSFQRSSTCACGAPQLSKSTHLGNLVIIGPSSARATDRPYAPEAHQDKITQSTGMATEMQRKKITWPPGLLEGKKNKTKNKQTNKVLSFSTLFFMFTIALITEEVLGRRISLEENHSGENERQ